MRTLVERVEVDEREVELGAWEWASRATTAAQVLDAEGLLALVDAVEGSLVSSGAVGKVDLLVAGRVLGGLGDADIRAILATADERVARRAPLLAA